MLNTNLITNYFPLPLTTISFVGACFFLINFFFFILFSIIKINIDIKS